MVEPVNPLPNRKPHQLIGRSPSHMVSRGFSVCAVAPLCGVYVAFEKCAGFLSTSEQPSLHGWNSNSQTNGLRPLRSSPFVICYGHGHRSWHQDAIRLFGLLGSRCSILTGVLGA